jgi:hypothetical protein
MSRFINAAGPSNLLVAAERSIVTDSNFERETSETESQQGLEEGEIDEGDGVEKGKEEDEQVKEEEEVKKEHGVVDAGKEENDEDEDEEEETRPASSPTSPPGQFRLPDSFNPRIQHSQASPSVPPPPTKLPAPIFSPGRSNDIRHRQAASNPVPRPDSPQNSQPPTAQPPKPRFPQNSQPASAQPPRPKAPRVYKKYWTVYLALQMAWEREQKARGEYGMYWLLDGEYLAGEGLLMEVDNDEEEEEEESESD